jgi:hypothetical protein
MYDVTPAVDNLCQAPFTLCNRLYNRGYIPTPLVQPAV